MDIIPTIEKYLNNIITDKYHRYKSWDNCNQSFWSNNSIEMHALELAFYLASWGMYRGSSGLLQKNHLVHEGVVKILYSKESLELKCDQHNEVSKESINEILNLRTKLADYYSTIYFTKGVDEPKQISPTNTLISKVLLGTLSCLPAYDRYFIVGLKEMKIKHTSLDSNSLNELFGFIDNNKKEIEKAQKLILTKTGKHYPIMKILDMYFWQIGYDKETEEISETN